MSAEQILAAFFGGIALASGTMALIGLTINLFSHVWGVKALAVWIYVLVCVVASLAWANLEGLM
jgi:hypothetical protein